MKVSFFEEFPTKENLKKIKLINFKTKLYLASYSLKEFKNIKESINSKYIDKIIYWPLIEKEDGYWFSPFINSKTLKNKVQEFMNYNGSIMWDAEFPINKGLIFRNILQFRKNKKTIKNFFRAYKGELYTAEYFDKKLIKSLLNFCCLNFSPKIYNNYVIKMIYTSNHNYNKRLLGKLIRLYKKKYKDKFIIGLGTIATGIKDKEIILKPKGLENDLEMCKNNDINEVVIFRLGGLNKDYIKVIKKFI